MFYACVSIIIYVVHIVLRYYYFKGIRLIRSYDKGLILKIFSFSTWSLIGNISTVFKLQGIAIILNIFFGPTGNAVKGIVQQIRGSLEGFALTVQLAVKPQVIKSYSQNHIRSNEFSSDVQCQRNIFADVSSLIACRDQSSLLRGFLVR